MAKIDGLSLLVVAVVASTLIAARLAIVSSSGLSSLLQQQEPQSDILREMMQSAAACSSACSGPKIEPAVCASFWTLDATIYDMKPPNGVIRGRAEFQSLLERQYESNPQTKSHSIVYDVKHAGWIGGATTVGWQTGLWRIFGADGKKMLQMGSNFLRYSAIMKKIDGVWKYFVVASMDVSSHDDWVPVKNGLGGNMLGVAQHILTDFTTGFNSEDYNAAFVDYSAACLFPVMTPLGGTSLDFAKIELKNQRAKLSPVQLDGKVDEVIMPISDGNNDIAVAHGFIRMLDKPARLWTFGRFSFLFVLQRDISGRWLVVFDFSPNNWIEPM